jgi:hypothetical protein
MTTPTTPITASVVDFLKNLCSALQAEPNLSIGYEAMFDEALPCIASGTPGTRAPSPTAPRAEGGAEVTVGRGNRLIGVTFRGVNVIDAGATFVECEFDDCTLNNGLGLPAASVSRCAFTNCDGTSLNLPTPTPPRDRCEVCEAKTKRIQAMSDDDYVQAMSSGDTGWIKPCPRCTPCEVCGGTKKVPKNPRPSIVRVSTNETFQEYYEREYMETCPTCTPKETPCESGSGSASGVASPAREPVADSLGTAGASSVAPSSSATSASGAPRQGSDAASDPATVAGEGPYRVERSKQAVGWWEVAPLTTYDGSTIFKEHMDAIDAARIANHAHRTALAVREAEVVRLRRFAEEMAEYDCDYPNSPCLAVHISELGHGMCVGCKAREALKEAHDALKGAAT